MAKMHVLHMDDVLREELPHSVGVRLHSSWAEKRLDAVLEWLTDHVLAARWMFLLALVVPIIALLPAVRPYQFQILFFSNWVQWWALPALQRTANRIQINQAAKADADHATLQHLHGLVAQMYDEVVPKDKEIA